MGQYLTDIVTAGAEHGEDRIADTAFQGTSRQTPIRFHVTDLWLDSASSFEQLCERRGDAAPLAADQDAGLVSLLG